MHSERGFTLIEILVALVIVSVGVLALGGFGISIMGSGQVSRERLTAVHLAEQVLEFWQNDANDRPPSIAVGTCGLTTLGADPAGYPVTVSCTPDAGIGISYTIVVNRSVAQAPLPSLPNNSFAGINNNGAVGVRDMVGTITPWTKVVTVSWLNKGNSRSVFLTHMTKMP
ncbi:prepilin-type N-terminal cleavage/methylation domain-containing protein [Mariprofundus sp. NF]|uniref:type IV pilus modification PilV family protein n=1 Tax=Mariprofundus sp. NF TaxID=2608716 RepID=UPI0015A23103|nr:prepilin-type N-terminal cleavage/methylation domain-containing protein [Mariprofundus sp. NF]NWF38154.1 prepilin-type N-terminal cleavage/methylation domain-containing protein [Mariprofundus sp. NF]